MRIRQPADLLQAGGQFRRQLALWTEPGLRAQLDRIARAELHMKTTGLPAETVCRDALLASPRPPLTRAEAGHRERRLADAKLDAHNLLAMTKVPALYDQDFVLWAAEQGAALRRAKGSNLPLDWENLAEEIESLGASQRAQLNFQIRRILRHLMKLEASPAMEPRAGWRATIREARAEIEDLIEQSPSLRRHTDAMIAKQLPAAAKLAAEDLAAFGEAADAVRRITQGGFTAEEVLGDWFPRQDHPSPEG